MAVTRMVFIVLFSELISSNFSTNTSDLDFLAANISNKLLVFSVYNRNLLFSQNVKYFVSKQ